jgi:PAS domain S-box-containing protein
LGFGIAFLFVFCALIFLLWMEEYFKGSVPYMSVFICAVIFSTWFGGVKPGILSIFLSALLLDYFFLPPVDSFGLKSDQLPRLIFFVLPSIFIVWLSSVEKRLRESLKLAHQDLEKTVEKLVENEVKLKEAQSVARIGSWETGVQSGVNSWSDEMYKLLGLEIGELPPTITSFLSFVHPEDLAFVKSRIDYTSSSLTGTNFNFRFIKKNGELRYGLSDARLDVDGNNKLIRLYGIIKDITERKIEEEKKDKTLKSLKEILFITSHRVRQPVANILGLSNLINDAEVSPVELNEMVNNMKLSAESLDNFTNELTTFITDLHEENRKKDD